MNKRHILFACICIILVVAAMLCLLGGKRPFAGIAPQDIVSAEPFIAPPEKTISLTTEEITELAAILDELAIYRQEESGRYYDGQLARYYYAARWHCTHGGRL